MKVLDVCTKTGHLHVTLGGRLYGNFIGRYMRTFIMQP